MNFRRNLSHLLPGLCLLLIFNTPAFGQQKEIDSVAVSILDKMSDVIGEIESCRFVLLKDEDHINQNGMVERTRTRTTGMFSGADRFMYRTAGEKGNKGYWYNGEVLTYYSYDENNYVTLPAPETSIATIDSIHVHFGMRFPAADLFYPSFTDDVIEAFDRVKFAGLKLFDGKEYLHIIADNKELSLQLWIGNDGFYMPLKYSYTIKSEQPLCVNGTFEEWELGVQIPESVFEFNPPEGARLISILAKE